MDRRLAFAFPVLLLVGCAARAGDTSDETAGSRVKGGNEWRTTEVAFTEYDVYDPARGEVKARQHEGTAVSSALGNRDAFARTLVDPEAEGRFQALPKDRSFVAEQDFELNETGRSLKLARVQAGNPDADPAKVNPPYDPKLAEAIVQTPGEHYDLELRMKSQNPSWPDHLTFRLHVRCDLAKTNARLEVDGQANLTNFDAGADPDAPTDWTVRRVQLGTFSGCDELRELSRQLAPANAPQPL